MKWVANGVLSRMPDREMLLSEFRKCYERLEAVRDAARHDDPAADVAHAEQNFFAVAESLARLLSRNGPDA